MVTGECTRALRGATTVERNDEKLIIEATMELLTTLLEQNGLDHEEIISIIFTSTQDLNAAYPAVGARRLGLTHVPLMCATELPVLGSLPHCIRCLMHIHTVRPLHELRHVYLHEARSLRPDLTSHKEQ
jgi:chorismate mutase